MTMASIARTRTSAFSRILSRGLATPSPSTPLASSSKAPSSFSQQLANGPTLDDFIAGREEEASERVVLGNTSQLVFSSKSPVQGVLTRNVFKASPALILENDHPHWRVIRQNQERPARTGTAYGL